MRYFLNADVNTDADVVQDKNLGQLALNSNSYKAF